MNVNKKRAWFWFVTSLIGLVVLLGVGGFVWWQQVLQPVDKTDTESVAVVIPENSGASAMSLLLAENGLIKSPLAFRLFIKQHGWDRELKPGRYQFSKSQSLPEMAEIIRKGVLEDFWVTIPEGKRREEVAKLLKDAFTENNLEFSIPVFMQISQGIEGYLFPDTYLLPKASIEEDVVQLMRDTFDAKIPDEMKLKANDLDLSFPEAMILASLVEREAKFDEDRPKIAGVLLNRIKEGMALQIDATVQYAVGEAACQDKLGQDCDWWPVIFETTFDSPYNTYQHAGLPPAPICNPGLSVIESVLNPEDHGYLYYLSEDDGTTHYSKTLAEHEEKINKYLK